MKNKLEKHLRCESIVVVSILTIFIIFFTFLRFNISQHVSLLALQIYKTANIFICNFVGLQSHFYTHTHTHIRIDAIFAFSTVKFSTEMLRIEHVPMLTYVQLCKYVFITISLNFFFSF